MTIFIDESLKMAAFTFFVWLPEVDIVVLDVVLADFVIEEDCQERRGFSSRSRLARANNEVVRSYFSKRSLNSRY